ncbi:hypothetical protein R5R35_013282 [Gryllus longicercus]
MDDAQLAIRRRLAEIICSPRNSEAGPSGMCGRAAKRPCDWPGSSSSMAAGAPPGREAAKIEPSRRSRRIERSVRETASPPKRQRRDSVQPLSGFPDSVCTPELDVKKTPALDQKSEIAKECASVDSRNDFQAKSNGTAELENVSKIQLNRKSPGDEVAGKECASVVEPLNDHVGSSNGTAELEATKTESTRKSHRDERVVKESTAVAERNDLEEPSNGTAELYEATKTDSNRRSRRGERLLRARTSVESRSNHARLSNDTAKVQEAAKSQSKRIFRRSDRVAKDLLNSVVDAQNNHTGTSSNSGKLEEATKSESNRMSTQSDRIAMESVSAVVLQNTHVGTSNDLAKLEEAAKSQSNRNLRRSDRVAKESASGIESHNNHIEPPNDTANMEATKSPSNRNLGRSVRVAKELLNAVVDTQNNLMGPSNDTGKSEDTTTRSPSNPNLRRSDRIARNLLNSGVPRNNHIGLSNNIGKLEEATESESNRKLPRSDRIAMESASAVVLQNTHLGTSNDLPKLEEAAKSQSNRNLRRSIRVAKERASAIESRDLVGPSIGTAELQGARKAGSNRKSFRGVRVVKESKYVEPRNNFEESSNSSTVLEEAAKTMLNRKSPRGDKVVKGSAAIAEPQYDVNESLNCTMELEEAAKTDSTPNFLRSDRVVKKSAAVTESLNDLEESCNVASELEEAAETASNRKSPRSDKVEKDSAAVLEPRDEFEASSNGTAKSEESIPTSPASDGVVKESAAVFEPRNELEGSLNDTAELENAANIELNRKSPRCDKVAIESAAVVDPWKDFEDTSKSAAELEEAAKTELIRKSTWSDTVAQENAAVDEPWNDLEESSNGTTELEGAAKSECNRKLLRDDRAVKEKAAAVEPRTDLEDSSSGTAELGETSESQSHEERPMTSIVSEESTATRSRCVNLGPSKRTQESEEFSNLESGDLALEFDVDVEALVHAVRVPRGKAELSVCAPKEAHAMTDAAGSNTRLNSKCGEQGSKNDSAVKLRQCSSIPPSVNSLTSMVNGAKDVEVEEDVEAMVPAARLLRRNAVPLGISKVVSEKRATKPTNPRSKLRTFEARPEEDATLKHPRRRCRTQESASLRATDLQVKEGTIAQARLEAQEGDVDVEEVVRATRLATGRNNAWSSGSREEASSKTRQRGTTGPSGSSVIAPQLKDAAHIDARLTPDTELDVEAVVPAARLQRSRASLSLGVSEKVSENRKKTDTGVRRTSKSREVDDSNENVSTTRRLRNIAVTSWSSVSDRQVKETSRTDESPMTSDADLDVEAVVPAVRLRRSSASQSVDVSEKVSENRRKPDTEARSTPKSSEVDSDDQVFTTRRRLRKKAARSSAVDPRVNKPADTEAIRMTQGEELDVEDLVPATRLRRDVPLRTAGTSEDHETKSPRDPSVCRKTRISETEVDHLSPVNGLQSGASGLQSDTPEDARTARDSADTGGKRKAELGATSTAMKRHRAAEGPLTDALETTSDDEIEMEETVSATRHEIGPKEPLTNASELFRDVQDTSKTKSSHTTRESNEGLEGTLSASEQYTEGPLIGRLDTPEANEGETDSTRNMRGMEDVIEESSLEKSRLRDTSGSVNDSQEATCELQQWAEPETRLDTRDLVDVVKSVTPASPEPLVGKPEAVDGESKQGVKRGAEGQVDPTTRTKRQRCGSVVTPTVATTATSDTLGTESNVCTQGTDIEAYEATGVTRQVLNTTCTGSEVSDSGANSAPIHGPNEPRERLESVGAITDTARVDVDGNEVTANSDAADQGLDESNATRIEVSERREMETEKEALERIRAYFFRKVGSRTLTLVPVVRKLDVSAAVGGAANDMATVKDEPDVPTASSWAATEEADDDDIVEVARIIAPPRGVIVRGPLCPPGPLRPSASPRPGVIVYGRHVAAAAAAPVADEKASMTSESPSRDEPSRFSELPDACIGGRVAEEAPSTRESPCAGNDTPHATAVPRAEPGMGARTGVGSETKSVVAGGSGIEVRQTAGDDGSDSESDSASGVGSAPGIGSRASETESESASVSGVASESGGEVGAAARVESPSGVESLSGLGVGSVLGSGVVLESGIDVGSGSASRVTSGSASGSATGPGLVPRATTAEAAARTGQWVRLVQLLVSGADPDAPGPTGARALHHAAVAGHVASVRTLLSHGADVRSRGADDQEALHCAAAGGSAACVALLVAAGADVDAGDSSGWTALHWAAATGREASAEALLRAGASLHVGDRRGRKPVFLAQGASQRAVAALLRSRDISGPKAGSRSETQAPAR